MPVGRGRYNADGPDKDLLEKIARTHGKTIQQVCLRWEIQQGMTPLPRSNKPDHIRANIDIFDFELSDEEMMRINSINREEPMNRDIYNFNF
jgi:diketogulonate reductase-like aldo/keto reductase